MKEEVKKFMIEHAPDYWEKFLKKEKTASEVLKYYQLLKELVEERHLKMKEIANSIRERVIEDPNFTMTAPFLEGIEQYGIKAKVHFEIT